MSRPTPRAAALALAVVLSAALTACGSDGTAGPSLTMPDAATHARFPMGADSSHASCTCNDCHVPGQASPGIPADSFKVFTCVGCHDTTPLLPHGDKAAVDARHAAVPAYEYRDEACLRCHPAGVAVDHAARFPLPHRNAAGTVVTQCSQCHVSAADRKVMGCAACHPHDLAATTTAHARVPDFAAADSRLCLRCHADGTVPRVAAHTAFPIAAGAHSGAAGGKCLACHPSNRTTAPRTYAADFTRTVCLGCHVEVRPGVFHDSAAQLATLHDAGTSITDATCLGCHKDGAGGAPGNHPLLFPIGSGTRHAGVACGQCHSGGTDLTARRNLNNLACASCHAAIAGFSARHTIAGYTITSFQTAGSAGGARSTVQVSMTTPAGCLRCHADSQVDRVRLHPGGDSGFGQGDHRTAGCFTCHFRLRTDKPWGANFGTASGSAGPPPSSCYVCHRTGSG